MTPLTDETKGLIGADELAALAPKALFVDVSRGGVTNLDALLAALDSGQLSSATVDVFETEPLPAEDPLWEAKGLIVTPHTAAWSVDYAHRLFSLLHQSVLDVEAGRTPANVVDRARGY